MAKIRNSTTEGNDSPPGLSLRVALNTAIRATFNVNVVTSFRSNSDSRLI